MKRLIIVATIALLLPGACVTKQICANGQESFRQVLDPENGCKVRIRQVVVGSEIKLPASTPIDGSAVVWTYDWIGSEFKGGQLELGHMILRPESGPTLSEKK